QGQHRVAPDGPRVRRHEVLLLRVLRGAPRPEDRRRLAGGSRQGLAPTVVLVLLRPRQAGRAGPGRAGGVGPALRTPRHEPVGTAQVADDLLPPGRDLFGAGRVRTLRGGLVGFLGTWGHVVHSRVVPGAAR